jgi:hypothetical protein
MMDFELYLEINYKNQMKLLLNMRKFFKLYIGIHKCEHINQTKYPIIILFLSGTPI